MHGNTNKDGSLDDAGVKRKLEEALGGEGKNRVFARAFQASRFLPDKVEFCTPALPVCPR